MVVQGKGLERLQARAPRIGGNRTCGFRWPIFRAGSNRQPAITEQTSAAPADGQRRWTLQLDQRAFGVLWLVVDLTSARAADAATFDLPDLRVLSAERQSGFIAIEGGPDQKLDVKATDAAGQPLSPVDPADVPAPRGYAPKERIVAAFRAVRPGFRVAAQETRYDRKAVPTAICDKASLTSVIGESGQEQHKAEFVLRAVGVQSLRIELPEKVNLWATLIDNRPIEVRVVEGEGNALSGWIVPLPQGSDPGQTHVVQLFYRTEGESLRTTGTLRQVAPRIDAVSGQGDRQPIEILDREWTLYHPADTEITSSSGQFEPVVKPSRESFLGRLHQSLSLVSPAELWQKALVVAITAAVLGIFFFAYRRRGIVGAAVTAVIGVTIGGVLLVLSFVSHSPLGMVDRDVKSAATVK